MQRIIEIPRRMRDQKELSFKQPLKSLRVSVKDARTKESLKAVKDYIREEVNVAEVIIDEDFKSLVVY